VINEISDPDDPEQNVTLINPRIVSLDGDKTTCEEGCLSFPEIYAEVVRPDRCTVEAVDLEGQPLHREFSGFLSRIVQHEYDHLEGILLVDRMSPADKLKNKVALEELVAEYKDRRASS
jgi:peptide deformylase